MEKGKETNGKNGERKKNKTGAPDKKGTRRLRAR